MGVKYVYIDTEKGCDETGNASKKNPCQTAERCIELCRILWPNDNLYIMEGFNLIATDPDLVGEDNRSLNKILEQILGNV